jgi:hypothetical protein
VTAVIAYLVVAVAAVVVALLAAGLRFKTQRDPAWDLGEISARHVGPLGGLAGFAVTGTILLVTLARDAPNAGGATFTSILAMFVVAYIGNFSASLMFANVTDKGTREPFDLGAAQFAGASISLYFVYVGWLALRPLFETFGLVDMAVFVGYLLLAAFFAGYGQLASALNRSGYATPRQLLLMPLLGLVGAGAYVGLVQIGVLDHDPDATLALALVAFIPGVIAYLGQAILPIAARDPRYAPILAERWHLALLGYAQSVIVLVCFLEAAVLGFA